MKLLAALLLTLAAVYAALALYARRTPRYESWRAYCEDDDGAPLWVGS